MGASAPGGRQTASRLRCCCCGSGSIQPSRTTGVALCGACGEHLGPWTDGAADPALGTPALATRVPQPLERDPLRVLT